MKPVADRDRDAVVINTHCGLGTQPTGLWVWGRQWSEQPQYTPG